MKLRELLSKMKQVQEAIEASTPMICGGTPRDRYLGHLENIADVDITTGDKTVDYLSQEFEIELRKQYKVTRTTATDGHSTIHLGDFKMDFSSNFNAPNIDALLAQNGIKNPTDMQKEMFSRDFTCNALLLSLDLKQLSDPTHQGFKDIKDKTIRTCLSPEITLTTNKNRVIRAIYLASKLDFNIDKNIINYVQKNPAVVKIATNKVLTEKLNEAFKRDPEKASFYLTKMNLWDQIPITENVQPYYMKTVNMPQKKAYFLGGGGVNEPTPGKQKYKADPAIVVQPRFEEPFYRNYDLYAVPGMEDIGPGVGWHSMQNFKSVKDYLDERRKRLQPRYVADDSWKLDDGKITNKNPKMEARVAVLTSLLKTAQYMLPPKEHGTSIYNWRNSIYQGKPGKHKKDSNDLDFVSEDEVTPIIGDSESFETPKALGPIGEPFDTTISPGQVNLGDFESYPYSAQIGGLLDKYLPQNDFEDKTPDELDFGRDYSEEILSGRPYESEGDSSSDNKLEELFNKYLNPAPTHGLYGLPDGVDLPDEDLGDPTDLNPDYGTYGPESLIYEDKWNI